MYILWILIGMPTASLLCAAFITMRDSKIRLANTGVHRTHSAGDWKSESAVQVSIRILSKPSDDGFRVTYVARSDDEPWTGSKSEVWTLNRCRELLFIDEDSSQAEVGPVKETREIDQAIVIQNTNGKESEMFHPTLDT
jgi:hypothetical protein